MKRNEGLPVASHFLSVEPAVLWLSPQIVCAQACLLCEKTKNYDYADRENRPKVFFSVEMPVSAGAFFVLFV